MKITFKKWVSEAVGKKKEFYQKNPSSHLDVSVLPPVYSLYGLFSREGLCFSLFPLPDDGKNLFKSNAYFTAQSLEINYYFLCSCVKCSVSYNLKEGNIHVGEWRSCTEHLLERLWWEKHMAEHPIGHVFQLKKPTILKAEFCSRAAWWRAEKAVGEEGWEGSAGLAWRQWRERGAARAGKVRCENKRKVKVTPAFVS